MEEQQDLLGWGLGLIVGFPLLTLISSEVLAGLKRGRSELASVVRIVRNLVLPALALHLLVRHVLRLESTELATRLADTLLCAALFLAVLALLNRAAASEVRSEGWTARIPKLLLQLGRLLLLGGGIAFVLSQVWKVDLRSVITALGVGSLVMALALQDTLSNLVSGVLLIFDNPFKVGDWLRSGDVLGQVVDINWRSVRMRTLDGDMVVIPNGLLGKQVIHNCSQPNPLHAERLHVHLSYEVPPNQARRMIREVVTTDRGVVKHPAPAVSVQAYGEFAITYEVKFFIQRIEDTSRIRSELMTCIYYAARRHGLTLVPSSLPQHAPTAAPPPAIEGVARLSRSLEVLSSLLHLQPEAIATLARSATPRVYGEGEDIIRAGEPSKGLYIIISGQAVLSIEERSGPRYEVTSLTRGQFFGEVALSPGTASHATVTAHEDLEVLLLQPGAVMELAEKDPSFAREMEQLLEAQRETVQQARPNAHRAPGRGGPMSEAPQATQGF